MQSKLFYLCMYMTGQSPEHCGTATLCVAKLACQKSLSAIAQGDWWLTVTKVRIVRMTVRTRAAGHALCHSFDDDVAVAFVEKPAWCGKRIHSPRATICSYWGKHDPSLDNPGASRNLSCHI